MSLYIMIMASVSEITIYCLNLKFFEASFVINQFGFDSMYDCRFTLKW